MSNQLFDRYFISAAMAAVFSDTGRVQGMLDFEAALARAEARVGLIPQSAVAPIEAACRAERYDFAELAEAIALAGNSAIPLVKALGRQIAAVDPQAERYVHLGATSQDAMDTGLVLQLRQACALLDADLAQDLAIRQARAAYGVPANQVTPAMIAEFYDRSPSRSLPIGSLDAGVYFDRETEIKGDRFLQTLEPRLFYLKAPSIPAALDARLGPLRTLLENKYYFDRFNEIFFAGGARALGKGGQSGLIERKA